MAELRAERKSIGELFSEKKADYLIPDYQRPYAWTKEQCEILWNDIFDFALPNLDSPNYKDTFKTDSDEYFLGPIVTYKNADNKLEVIDGQQRLTTLMLLLRAFYSKFSAAQEGVTKSTKDNIAKCIWKTDEYGQIQEDKIKITSEVALEKHNEELLSILKTGQVSKEYSSNYADNYRFFQKQIDDYIDKYGLSIECAKLPARILNNCILLPIEADNEEKALRIFSTLNDRGMPLNDSDIFKAKLYKYFSKPEDKKKFIDDWKDLEEKCNKMFLSNKVPPMDELFTKYMYYERALQGNSRTTTEALRKFYEINNLLNKKETFENVKVLASFWQSIYNQDENMFSENVIKRMFVMKYLPNNMWQYIVSVYYMGNKKEDGKIDNDAFEKFLNKCALFILAYSFKRPGANALRIPLYPEMINIVQKKDVLFENYKFSEEEIRNIIDNYDFSNQRPITKSLLVWWAFNNSKQKVFEKGINLEIEHIYSRNRQENEGGLSNRNNTESLGNKAILEDSVNIRASDYHFADKIRIYKGFENDRGIYKKGTQNEELIELANSKNDFNEQDIIKRKQLIIDSFIDCLREESLLEKI